jgi:hypothetical protein
MSKAIGVVVGLAGVVCAVIFLFVLGIVQIVHGATATPVDATGIAVGAVRVVLTSLGIWISVFIGGAIALAGD